MGNISFDDFSKVDIRVGRVVFAEDVRDSEKLLVLKVDFGKLGEKTIFAGIKKWYKPKDLKGKLFTFVFNLEPKKMFGRESEGMLLAAEDEKGACTLVTPGKDVAPGTKVI